MTKALYQLNDENQKHLVQYGTFASKAAAKAVRKDLLTKNVNCHVSKGPDHRRNTAGKKD